MAGYGAVEQLRRLETEVDKLGFMLCAPKNRWTDDLSDLVAIKPKDQDSLPIYSRDTEVFVGTLDQLQIWVRGVYWARNYDEMLKLSNEKKREKKEQDERSRRLIAKLKKDHTTYDTAE